MRKDFVFTYESGERLTPHGLQGVVVPLVTPYINLDGRQMVDEESLSRLVRFVIGGGSNVLFAAGNVGDGRIVNTIQYASLVKKVVEIRNVINPTIPVVAGVLRQNIAELTIFSQIAESLGVNALVLAPLYGEGSPITKLETVLDTTRRSVILYDNPAMTNGESLTTNFVERAIQIGKERIIGIKVSAKDPEAIIKMLRFKTIFFRVLQGETSLDAASLKLGADGIVPVEANARPELFSRLDSELRRFGNNDGNGSCKAVCDLLASIKTKKNETGKNTTELTKEALVLNDIFNTSLMHTAK